MDLRDVKFVTSRRRSAVCGKIGPWSATCHVRDAATGEELGRAPGAAAAWSVAAHRVAREPERTERRS